MSAITFRARDDGHLKAPGVTIDVEAGGQACGSAYCTESGTLVEIELADRERPRVLCPRHAGKYLERERGWGE